MSDNIEVKVKRMGAAYAPLPAYATQASAGMDLAANIPEPIELRAGERALIPTGIAIELPGPNMMALVFARSGLATKHGVNLANGVGVIDADYIGEIGCALQNSSDKPYILQPGDRIAQLVFVPIQRAVLKIVDELAPTERGTGGFGSTGQ
jgi:dUTP pyrophosphatase